MATPIQDANDCSAGAAGFALRALKTRKTYTTSGDITFSRRPAIDPVMVLGVAMFIIEGAVLDRWLVFSESQNLRDEFNRNFLEYAGVASGGDQDELLALVRENREQLNHIRAGEIGK